MPHRLARCVVALAAACAPVLGQSQAALQRVPEFPTEVNCQLSGPPASAAERSVHGLKLSHYPTLAAAERPILVARAPGWMGSTS